MILLQRSKASGLGRAKISVFCRKTGKYYSSRPLVGVGKTHIAIGLGYAATQSGIKTKFITAADLMLVLDAGLNQGNLNSIFTKSNNAI